MAGVGHTIVPGDVEPAERDPSVAASIAAQASLSAAASAAV